MFRTENLSHRFSDGTLGLSEVSIGFQEHAFTLLAGGNGSGKTLLLRHLLGLVKPTSGQIFYQDRPLRKSLGKVRDKTGLVWQDSNLQIVGQTLGEEVGFGLQGRGLDQTSIQEKVQRSLDQVGLKKSLDFPCSPLSGGEKRRLVLASMLAEEKECLLLDEPFAGLDWEGVQSVLEVLQNLKAQGITIILISHDLDKFLYLVDQVVLLNKGRILARGSVETVWEDFAKAKVHRPQVPLESWKSVHWMAR